MGVRPHRRPPLVVMNSTALPPAQSLAVTHPCSGSRKYGCSNARFGGKPPGTACIGVMSVHVLPKSSVVTTRWWHLEGSVARQRRTIVTPSDRDTSWNASTLVVRVADLDDPTDGVDSDTGVDGRTDWLGSGGEYVVHAAVTSPATSRPARTIFDGKALLSASRL